MPFLLGLTVVLPVLGHSTWHLYRALVAPDPGSQPMFRPEATHHRSAADFTG